MNGNALDKLKQKAIAAETNSLAERVKNALTQKQADAQARSQCLLLDVSGSMSEHVEPGRSKYDALRDLLKQFAGARKFAFASKCSEVNVLPRPDGSTDLAGAFAKIKTAGVRHAVLITDGRPDSEEDALREAIGLKLDIFYVGPQPAPDFLRRLAAATGGQFGATSLANQKQLATKIAGLLEGGSNAKAK